MSGGGPLAGFRVLEVCQMLAGPYCGLLLADLGAEVIKVEFDDGDIARHTGHHEIGGHNLYFASLNRNKKSILIDLKDEKDRRVFDDLVASSQGLITNMRPGAIKKLGLTYDDLKGLNPDLACLAITGFGLEGPYSEYPAYDYIIQAMAGVMMITGDPGSPPVRAGYSVADNSSGIMGALGLVAQLASGRGGQIDVALFDTILSQLNYLGSAYLNAGEEPQRQPAGGHSFFVPAQIFATADGYMALFITHDRFWREFALAVGHEEWVGDERFSTMSARHRNRAMVVSAIAEVVKQRPSEEWVALLQPRGIVVGAVGTLAEALVHESTRARNMVVHVTTPAGPIRLIGNPIKGSDVREEFAPPPGLGEHTAIFAGGASGTVGS